MCEAELSVVLPDNILRSRVCQNCFQYLSVGPIYIGHNGGSFCGRCTVDEDYEDDTELPTVSLSLYGILAQGFKFKCTNHINGCNEALLPAEMEIHEQNCPYFFLKDCFFCSFSGNLSQIVNHSSQCHPGNITFDGQFMFSLADIDSKKTFLYLLDDNLYLITIEITEEVIKISIQLQYRKVTANYFAIKFFKSEDPSDSVFILTDYGLLHDKFPSYFEKSMEHLVTSFGPGATLCCQILVDDVNLMDKDVEIQKRYSILRDSEEKLAQLQSKADSYNAATHIIKTMSHNFFKCLSCSKTCTENMYFCENIHLYCKNCCTGICKGCNTTIGLKTLKEFDFKVPCDYIDCNKVVKISEYLGHKLNCSKRPYKCPLKSCNEVVLSAKGLIEHWHAEIPKLRFEEIIKLETYKTEKFYWLIESDLYRVLVNFSEQNISVLIDEIDVSNANKITFKCSGYYSILGQKKWNKIPMSLFCGKSHINSANKLTLKCNNCDGGPNVVDVTYKVLKISPYRQ